MLQCIVVTPEQTLYDQPADFVAMTLFDGEIGIATHHTPMIGRLGFGEMRIHHEHGVDRYYVEGGFVEVLGDVVSVLTNRAVPVAEIDETVVEERLRAAQSRVATTPETMAVRDRTQEQCRAQLRVVRRTRD
jgi:F-type H+-transporting ATPase subunit epsilon